MTGKKVEPKLAKKYTKTIYLILNLQSYAYSCWSRHYNKFHNN